MILYFFKMSAKVLCLRAKVTPLPNLPLAFRKSLSNSVNPDLQAAHKGVV